MTDALRCSRCGRAARGDEPLWPGDGLPRGWEGSINDAICPGCQAVVLLER